MQEAASTPVAVDPEDEYRIVLIAAEERVERHDEAAFRRVSAPAPRHPLELRAQRVVDLCRPQDARPEAGLLESMHRLTHLPDRPTVEREARRVDDSLVAVVERS